MPTRSAGRNRGLCQSIAAVCLASSCGGPGIYGHGPNYVPSDEESSLLASAHQYDPAAGRALWSDESRRFFLFGIVESRTPGPAAQALLRLSVRSLEPQNLCTRPGEADSCRVTVSDTEEGALWALVQLRGDDDVGPRAVGQRSLVRLIGTIGQDVSPKDGAPVLHAGWYRHFPPSEYVTKK